MTATVLTLFNEFPLIFIFRIGISAIILFILVSVGIVLYKQNVIDKIQRNSFILFSVYNVVLLYFTVFGRYSQSYYRYETDVFASYRYLFESYDMNTLQQITLNLMILIPVGFFLCLIIKSRMKYFWALVISFVLTLLVEALQFVSRCGTFEVDDLINNMIGAVIGIAIYAVLKSLNIKREVL